MHIHSHFHVCKEKHKHSSKYLFCAPIKKEVQTGLIVYMGSWELFLFSLTQILSTFTSISNSYRHCIVSVITNWNGKCNVSRCHGSSTERRAEKHSNYENNEPHLGLGGALLKVPEQHVVFSQRYHTLPITHGLPQYTAGDMREDTDKDSHVHVFSER